MSQDLSVGMSEFVMPAVRGPRWWATTRARRALLVVLVLVPMVTQGCTALFDGIFLYGYCAVMCLVAAGFCVAAGVRHRDVRARWNTVAVAEVLASGVFAIASLHLAQKVSDNVDSFGRPLLAAAAGVLLLPALLVSRAGIGVLVRTLDVSLMVLGCAMVTVTNFGAEFGAPQPNMWVKVLIRAFIVCAGFTGLLAGDTPGKRQFSRAVVGFLVAGLVCRFFTSVVLVSWFPMRSTILINLLIVLDTVLLCEFSMTAASDKAWVSLERFDRNVIDSLQPTWVMLGTIVLSFYALRARPVWSFAVVVAVVLLYAVRTQAFYHRLFRERRELRSQASRLEELATRDALTSVGNRRWFDVEAAKLLASERNYPCSLVLVDTDKFKAINDEFGHPLGDEVLRAVAMVLSEVTAEVKRGCCARIGGDEFGALWPGVEAAEALELAELVRARVEALEYTDAASVTVSVGVATLVEEMALSGVMRVADAALYRAKAAGRNLVRG